MSDDYYAFDEKAHLLKGENSSRVYRLGDKVQAQVVRADLERRQIDLALVDVLERARSRRPPGRAPAARSASRRGRPAARRRRR
jgi:ribonuclease R